MNGMSDASDDKSMELMQKGLITSNRKILQEMYLIQKKKYSVLLHLPSPILLMCTE